jgi:exopolyphosphatase/pppGpp-phosphohydrolase
MRSFGVIEIGSNGLRYEVGRCGQGGDFESVYKQSTRASLISYVDGSSGKLSPQFKRLTIDQISLWQADARSRGLDRLVIITTEVGRQVAQVDPGFWSRENFVVNVLDPSQEALLSWMAGKGVATGTHNDAQAVVDVGNGSMSITISDESKPPEVLTAGIGGEKISQVFLETKGSASALDSFLRSSLNVSPATKFPSAVTLMGGFATKAGWQACRKSPKSLYNAEFLEGAIVTRTQLRECKKEIYNIISQHGAKVAQAFVDYKEPGAWKLMHVLASLSFFDVLANLMQVEQFRISTRSVRHGALSMECDKKHDFSLLAVW